MALIQFKNDKAYHKAVGIVIKIMLEFGIGFRTQYPRTLMWLGPTQLDALRKAGLIPAKPRKRRSKKAKPR